MMLEEQVMSERTAENIRNTATRLSGMDLSAIDSRVRSKFPGRDFVEGLRGEALRFLSIAAHTKEAIAPSKVVDEYWHEMVLNTPTYQQVSGAIGDFVHHNPSERPETAAYARTLELYRTVFGDPNSKYWVSKAGDCNASCNAGGGGSNCASYCSGGACTASCRD